MKMRGKGKRMWETGRLCRSTSAPTRRSGSWPTIGRVSLWLKKEEAQDMVATLTRALIRSAAMENEEKPDLSPKAVMAALQALLRSTN